MALLILTLLSGCGDTGGQAAGEGAATAAGSSTTASAPARVDDDPVIARLLGVPVSRAEYVAATRIDNLSAERQAEAFAAFDERYRLAAWLLQHQTDADVGADKATRLRLAESLAKQVLDTYFAQHAERTVTDAAVKAHYDSHPEHFTDKVFQVTALTLKVPPSDQTPPSEDPDAAKPLADEALTALADHPDDSQVKNVEATTLDSRTAPPAQVQRLLPLKPGQWSLPSGDERSRSYYRLDSVETHPQPFDQVQAGIRYALQQEARQAEYARLLNEIKAAP